MSETLGLVAHRDDRNQSQFLGMGGSERDYSEDTARRIDEEVSSIITESYRRAYEILSEKRSLLEEVVAVLFEKEIMEGEELRRMLGKAPADGDVNMSAPPTPAEPEPTESGNPEAEADTSEAAHDGSNTT